MGDQFAARRRAAVVIPTFDEQETIEALIREILAQQAQLPTFDLHVVVSDSTSRDRTIEIVRQLAQANRSVHLNLVRERGIGRGLYEGFCYSVDKLGADVLVEIDADFQHNPSDLPRLLNKLDEGYDLVVGSRFVPGSVNKMPWHRWVLSVGANSLIRLMLGLHGVQEITTSYRAFTRELFLQVTPESVPWQETSFIAVPVFLIRMLECGARAAEVPMTMHPRVLGYSKMDYGRYILDILRFSFRSARSRIHA